MTLNIRRVVTGHDAQGRSTVLIDSDWPVMRAPVSAARKSAIAATSCREFSGPRSIARPLGVSQPSVAFVP